MCLILQHVCLFHLPIYAGEFSMSGVPKFGASLVHFSEELTLSWAQEGSGGGVLPKYIGLCLHPPPLTFLGNSTHFPETWLDFSFFMVFCVFFGYLFQNLFP